MRRVLLYTSEELDKIAKETSSRVGGREAHFHRWELEISSDSWSKLHVYYYHMDDGQAMHLTIVELEKPT